MARYRLVETRFWSDAKVRSLSKPQPCGQFLLLRLMTGPETIIIPGVIVTTRAGLAEKMGWDAKGFAEAFAELSQDGWAKASWDAGLIWLPTAIKCNSPANPNVVKGWAKEWPEVPECALKSEILQALREHIEGLGKGFAEAFAERFPDGSANQEQYSGTVLRKQETLTSELANEPTENAPLSDPPCEPGLSLSSETTGESPEAPQNQSSQASGDVSTSVAKPKRAKKPPSPQAIEIAQHLLDSVSAHSPHIFGSDAPAELEKRLLGWTVHIDRCLRLDGATVEALRLCIDYAHHPDDPSRGGKFSWWENLLSGESLRKQWKKKKLLADATRWRGSSNGTTSRQSSLDDYDFVGAGHRVSEFMGETK